jgi:hypothetical protein
MFFLHYPTSRYFVRSQKSTFCTGDEVLRFHVSSLLHSFWSHLILGGKESWKGQPSAFVVMDAGECLSIVQMPVEALLQY